MDVLSSSSSSAGPRVTLRGLRSAIVCSPLLYLINMKLTGSLQGVFDHTEFCAFPKAARHMSAFSRDSPICHSMCRILGGVPFRHKQDHL
jgi:hypothetical protein